MRGYFDGSCGPRNPGGTAKFGWALVNEKKEVFSQANGFIGSGPGMTNNVAEYVGLLRLLQFIKENGLSGVDIYGDSKLVVMMVSGVWGKRAPHKHAPHLRDYLYKCRALLAETACVLRWIPREQNTLADDLSKL
jgi:ribonuclease HI